MITTAKSSYIGYTLNKYYVPGISHVGVRLKQEAQSNNFQDHLDREDDLKDKICVDLVLIWRRIRVVQGQKNAICENCQKDKSVEPSIKFI